ncbi:MAG: GAF domain-containing protein, partial [Deltaproteobacteria bacterium]|nr:GAF domain-containing protein [Deltaproteobacteria bacterium]
MEYDSFEKPVPMCEEVAQMITNEKLLTESLKEKELMLVALKKQEELLARERKAFALMAKAAVYAKDISDLCLMVIAGLMEILKFDLGVIRLKNGKDNSWRVVASVGLDKIETKLLPDDIESITMLVASTGKSIFAPDISAHKIEQAHGKRIDQFMCKAFISWPLHDSSQKIIGVATLVSHSPKEIPGKDKDFFEIIAGMLAIVIKRKLADGNITKALKEKELMLKEIHHRVKNNMQVISSLINLQAGRIEDQDYKNMFDEIRDRIRSMALVHEQLYRSRDLAYINLKDYITQLTGRLMRSYSIAPGKIELKIDANDLYIGIDKAVPCGLITNELISNALKYAFPDD